MTSSSPSDSHKINNISAIIYLVKIFATKQFAAKFELTSVNMKMYLSRVVKGETAPSREIVQELEAKKGNKRGDFISIVLIMAPSLLP